MYLMWRRGHCVCLTKFLQVFHFWHAKTRTQNARKLKHTIQKLTRIVTCDDKKYTSIDMLEIEMTRITR